MKLPQDNAKRQDDDGRSKRPLIIGAIVVSILILLLAFFLWSSSDEEDQDGPRTGVPQPPGTSRIISKNPTTTQGAPSVTQNDTPTTTTTPPTSTANRAPTTFRGAEEHIPGGEGAHPHRNEGDDPMVPERGTPADLSAISVQKIFTVNLRPGVTWETSFGDHARFFTPRLTESGFKKWWSQDEPEHTLGWRAAVDPDGESTLYAFPRQSDEEWLDDNRIRYTYNVRHMLRTRSGSTNLPSFKVYMDMVYVDGMWLLDDYSFPIGGGPSIH